MYYYLNSERISNSNCLRNNGVIRINWEGARSLSPRALLACEVINSATLRDLHTYNTKQAG